VRRRLPYTPAVRRQLAARVLPPLLLSAAVIAVAPFLGQLRDALLDRFPARALVAVTIALAVIAGIALLAAILRIRDHRAWRYGGLALCGCLVVLQVVGFATGNASVDVVERVHIVEYGLLAALYHRALRPAAGALGAALLAWLAAGLVGTVDEWVQWLVPTRVGDVRDVALNYAAAGTGALFALCLAPAAPLAWRLDVATRRAVAAVAAVALLAAARLFDLAHLGHSTRDDELRVSFRSAWTAAELQREGPARARRWLTDPPTLQPLGREDRYFTEGTWHVAQRNAHLTAGRLLPAWREQRLLERYYAPVLGRTGLVSGAPLDLAPHDRERLERAGRNRPRVHYESPVLADRLVLRPTAGQLWAVVWPLVLALIAVAGWPGRRKARAPLPAPSFSRE
jgi:hypothetical protein